MSRPRTGILITATLLLALAAGIAWFLLRDTRPNVVLISIDSLRADHLGTYGYERQTSPRIDELAREGVVFENTVSTTTWTLPAHLSMLTSLYPDIHGVKKGRTALSDQAALLPEILQTAEWATAAVVSGPFLASNFGYGRGFDLYDDQTISFKSHGASHRGITSPLIHDQAVDWLNGRPEDKPFFLFLHYWDVHYDYIPPPPYDTLFDPDYEGDMNGRHFFGNKKFRRGMDPRDREHVVALYDGEIAFVDEYLGKLFDDLAERGLWDDTLVIVTSDHGDEFLEHGYKGHRRNLYQSTLQVPLVVKMPRGRWAGKRIDSLVGIVDLAPTILELAGLESPPEFNGRSLLSLMKQGHDTQRYYYFADLEGKMKSVLGDRWKMITHHGETARRPELFDLDSDPQERRNIALQEPDALEGMVAIQEDWLTFVEATEDLETGSVEYQKELEELLESLGYLD